MAQSKAKKVQKVDVSAIVVDQNGEPLVGVAITANEGATTAVTDSDGSFTLNLAPGSMISFDLDGYKGEMLTTGQIATIGSVVGLTKEALKNVYTDVKLPYQTKQQYKSVGSISVVDAEAEIERDNRTTIGNALYGKVTGITSLTNMRGLGSGAITVVDGIIRDVDNLSLQEVESITVLKDAASRMLYGAEGTQGVILITTKRGEANKQTLKFEVEGGIQSAISYPSFLTGADYMYVANQAYTNDNLSAPYTSTQMDNTYYNTDSVLYPNEDYYSSQWVKDITNYTRFYGEASGGNDIASYFMSAGWSHNEGWLNNVDNSSDEFNVRGKVDLKVNNWLTLNTDISVAFDIENTPYLDDPDDIGDYYTYWDKSITALSTAFPVLIPIDRISNYDSLNGVTNIVDGKYLLGGTSVYQENLYGDLNFKGDQSYLARTATFKAGFDMDLSGITKGLTATGAGSFDFYNEFLTYNESTYAVYEVTGVDEDGMLTVTQHGNDVVTTSESVAATYTDFTRSLSGYAALNYARTFDKHDVSAVLTGYGYQHRYKGTFQEDRRLNAGLQVGYVYDDKYVLDAAMLYQGSGKMPEDNRWASSPSIGGAWIVSNEDFLKDSSVIDFLKLRTSYGIIKDDSWTSGSYDGYFLYSAIYEESSTWTYNNTANKNTSILISSSGYDYDWQTRKEFNIGFDAYLFDKSTWIEATYYNSTTADIMTTLSNTTYATAGSVTAYGNYNSVANRGYEIGINHNRKIGQVDMTIGLNYLHYDSEILEYEEAEYSDELSYLSRIGHSNAAMWCLVADGLYSDADFNTDGSLVEGVVESSYATVQAGDIKYVDQNNDGVINSNDIVDTGYLTGNNNYLSLNLDLKYNNWQFFAQVAGAFGGMGYKNSDYYWFTGTDAAYSEFAKLAYDPENPDPNAECPRLTTGTGTNNYRNSTFWIYDRSYVSLEAVQLGYTFNTKSNAIKKLKLYVRGSNLFRIAKDKDVQQLNYGSAPQSRLYSFGIVTSF